MIRKRTPRMEVRATCLSKAGQTLENIKTPERTRAIVVTKDTFHSIMDCVTEEDRIAVQQAKKAAKLAAMRKATYEKSKTWGNTIQNIKVRQREELLSKKQRAEEERRTFVKEMTEKRAAERTEVVQQARRLLQQKRPLCRQINRALLVSESLRELDAQVAFQKTIKATDKEQDVKYANSIKADAAKFEELKKQEAEERGRKIQDYRSALTKQIQENERDNKLKAAKEMEAEREDLKNTNRDIELTKKKEMQDILNKKERLQKFFKEAIEEKKRFELELKHNEELEDRALEVYREAKDRIQQVRKSLALKRKDERVRKMQITADQYVSSIQQDHEAKEQEIWKKAVEEKEAAEVEKRRAQKEREKKMRALMEEYKLHDVAVKTKQRQEEKELRAWEMMQRFKRDEYNKRIDLEERKRQWQQKLEYANELRKNIEEKQVDKEREKEIFEVEETKAAIERANQRILLYGDEVLKESRSVRPLYPILKAIEEIKKEMGLTPDKKKTEEPAVKVERPKRKDGARRCVCPKPVPVDQMHYLQ